MTDEPKKRARRCAACIYCHTVSTRELPFDAGVGDFCTFETKGELLDERLMTPEWYEGECPAGFWVDLPEIDHEREAALRQERLVAEQVRQYGPVLETIQDGLGAEQRRAVGSVLVTRELLQQEAREAIDAELDGGGEAGA